MEDVRAGSHTADNIGKALCTFRQKTSMQMRWERQLVARQKKAHVTVESRRHTKDKETCHTEGTGKTDEPANMGSYLDQASRAEMVGQ